MWKRSKPTAKLPVPLGEPPDPPEVLAGEVVRTPAGEPLVASKRQIHEYKPEYPAMILKMFEDMLAASGEKIHDRIIEEAREVKERTEPERVGGEESKDGHKRRPRGELQVMQKRTIKRNEWRLVMAEIPSFAKFGRLIGVSSNVLMNWRASYPAFTEASERCTDMLEDALIQRGLRGLYDAEMVKFVGTNWTKLRDRKEITGADGAPLNPPAELRFVSPETLDAAEKILREARQMLIEGRS